MRQNYKDYDVAKKTVVNATLFETYTITVNSVKLFRKYLYEWARWEQKKFTTTIVDDNNVNVTRIK